MNMSVLRLAWWPTLLFVGVMLALFAIEYTSLIIPQQNAARLEHIDRQIQELKQVQDDRQKLIDEVHKEMRKYKQ